MSGGGDERVEGATGSAHVFFGALGDCDYGCDDVSSSYCAIGEFGKHGYCEG